MPFIRIDGVRFKLEKDENSEFSQSSVHSPGCLQKDEGMQEIIQPTELGESLKELNDDSIESESRMSGIDMRARLHPIEINSILAIDTLVALKVLPVICLAYTRQKKRLSVSLDGQGRKEIVEVIGGKRELDAKKGMGGMMDRGKAFMGMG